MYEVTDEEKRSFAEGVGRLLCLDLMLYPDMLGVPQLVSLRHNRFHAAGLGGVCGAGVYPRARAGLVTHVTFT